MKRVDIYRLLWSHASWVVVDAQQEARVHRSSESDECAMWVMFICLPMYLEIDVQRQFLGPMIKSFGVNPSLHVNGRQVQAQSIPKNPPSFIKSQ